MIQQLNGTPVLAKLLSWPTFDEVFSAEVFKVEPLSLCVACYVGRRETVAPIALHNIRRLKRYDDRGYQFMGDYYNFSIMTIGDQSALYEERGGCLVRIGSSNTEATIAFTLKSRLVGA